MKSEAHPPDTLPPGQSDLDHDSLASLVLFDGLSEDQAERLTEAGVVDCRDLVEKLREETTGDFLLRRTGIPLERLFLAGAMANLLQVRGPGSIAAVEVLKNVMSWIDLDDSEDLDMLVGLLIADRQDALSFIALHVEEAKAKARMASRSWWQRWYPLAFFGVMMLWAISGQWSHLFPPAAESSFDQAVLAFERNMALSYLVAFAIAYGLLALGLYVFMWAVRPSGYGRISLFLGRVLLSDRDTVVLWETGEIAPDNLKKRMQSTQRAWNWLGLVVLAVGLGGALLGLDAQTVMWLVGASFIVGITALTALELFVFHEGFAYWKTKWAEQVRLHYVSHTVVTSVLGVGIIGLAFALALFVASEVGVRLAVPWSSQMAESGKTTFLAALAATDLAAEDRPMAQAWAERRAAGWQQEIAAVGSEAKSAVADTLDALLDGIIASLVVFTALAFVAGARRRGLIALLFPLLLWVIGELVPDVVGQISAGQSPFVKLSLTALAVSLVIAILSNVLGERAAQRDERECSRCYLLAGKDANFCKECGAPLFGIPISS
jgi:hypothetical protein